MLRHERLSAVLDLLADKGSLSVERRQQDAGAAANHEGEAEVNRLMVEHARQVVVVADASKLERHAFCRICDIGSANVLITDSGANPATIRELRALGVEVETV